MPLSDDQLLERFNRMKSPTSVEFNCTVVGVDSARGWARLQFDIGPQYCNPFGVVQGGIVTALMDESVAFACIAKAQSKIFVLSLELKATFLSSAQQGLLYAEATCIKYGKTIAFVEAELQNPEGKILAKLTTTVVPRPVDRPQNLIDTTGEAN